MMAILCTPSVLAYTAGSAPMPGVCRRCGVPPTMQLDGTQPDGTQNTLSARAARIALPVAAVGVTGVTAAGLFSTFTGPGSTMSSDEEEEARNRLAAVDPRAEATMARYYPGSLGSQTIDRLVADTLGRKGYTPGNTILATSTCSDEVNYKPKEMIDLMTTRWGENFALGGLAGVPFVGKAGFGAYSHHTPDGGKMLILFAPHVGVGYDGTVGKIQRVSQAEVSTACGAAVGAFKALMKERKELLEKGVAMGAPPEAQITDYFSAQINYIIYKLRARLEKVMSAPDAQTFVAYQMYTLTREALAESLFGALPGFFDYGGEVAVVGGIQVNRADGGDRFMPLMFQTLTKGGVTTDLYAETFGPPPDLTKALGGTIPQQELFGYRLEKKA